MPTVCGSYVFPGWHVLLRLRGEFSLILLKFCVLFMFTDEQNVGICRLCLSAGSIIDFLRLRTAHAPRIAGCLPMISKTRNSNLQFLRSCGIVSYRIVFFSFFFASAYQEFF